MDNPNGAPGAVDLAHGLNQLHDVIRFVALEGHLERHPTDCPTSHEKRHVDRRAGALAGLEAMRALVRTAADQDSNTSLADGFQAQDAAVSALCDSFEGGSDFQRGFLMALGEFIYWSDQAPADLDGGWMPEACLTPEQLQRERLECVIRSYE